MDKWRNIVDEMEDLALRPGTRPENVEQAREHLAAMLGRVRLVPENGHVVAEVGLEALKLQPKIRVVAGAGFAYFRRLPLK